MLESSPMDNDSIILVLDNLRSSHNVGSLIRTMDGLGFSKIIATGTTPHPKQADDNRLPHVIHRNENQINKTALGALNTVEVAYSQSCPEAIATLKNKGYAIWAIEQTDSSSPLTSIQKRPKQLALILGSETDGVDQKILDLADESIEIPMKGQKSSLNVSVAGAIALFHLSNQEVII